jgi:hypothetical protein
LDSEKNVSTTNATCKLLNDILQALNNKRNCGGIFFDLEKAFDCVDHEILLNKEPEFMGIKVYNNLPGNIKLLSNNKKGF